MKITAENYIGKTEEVQVSIQIPDDSGIDKLIETFYSICVALTYHPDTALEAFRDFTEEHQTFEDALKDANETN